MNVLVTGGAGYIGSNMVRMLVARGHNPIVLDSLQYGHKQAIPASVPLIVGNIKDKEALVPVFQKYHIDAVIHFAGYLMVEESVREPIKYMHNNVIYPVTLLDVMHESVWIKLFFPRVLPYTVIRKRYRLRRIIRKIRPVRTGFRSGVLKNFCGYSSMIPVYVLLVFDIFMRAARHWAGKTVKTIIQKHHIIPVAIRTAMGKQKEFYLYGTDYPTRDGSCLRDYIHIEDLAEAHLLALEALMLGHKTDVYNLATGDGTTNKEVVAEVKKVTGLDFSGKRSGTPAG